MADTQLSSEELAAAIREVRDRARARVPQGPLAVEGVNAVNLMPIVNARDVAESKVAAIGTVNPRRGGLLNSLVQGVKRLIARSLNWHVREQVEFNRGMLQCVQATLDAFSSVNHNMAVLAARVQEFDAIRHKHAELDKWRQESQAEQIYMLRMIAELQAAYQQRLSIEIDSFKGMVRSQHQDFRAELDATNGDIQKRLWDDLTKVREQHEFLIQDGLRLLRQRSGALVASNAASSPNAAPALGYESPDIDWEHFAERFRGSEARVRSQQDRYLRRFAGTQGCILDIGCGRGEFLEAAAAAGLKASGVDLSPENVAACVAKGLHAECVDVFAYLQDQRDGSVTGVHCAQVIEHLQPAQLVKLVALLGKKVAEGGWVAFETPNPECLAIFATHFYIDPTHVRPVPSTLLRYYLEAAGFGAIAVEGIEPAVDSMPSLAELPAAFREQFFGTLDYALFAQKL